jgi:polar amino acid transport system substrate-binding protein
VKKIYVGLAVFLALILALSACAQAPQQPATEAPPAETEAAAEPTAAAGADKLQEVLERGTLIVSTDPAYPPQSELVEGAERPADTKCASDQHVAAEFSGFDIDASVAIAEKLGVEACFVTPSWDLITAGNWADRWDISVGSMTITPERMNSLYFSQPYYTTPAAFFVHQDNATYTQPADLSGKKIGGCTACTYEFYVDGSLSIPGEEIEFLVTDAEFVGYDTDIVALQDLALGDGVRLDAVLTAQPTGLGAIDDGLPLKQLGEPVYFEYLAAAIDKAHRSDPVPLASRVSEAIEELLADGTLKQLAEKYYGLDLASAAADFDLQALNQWP